MAQFLKIFFLTFMLFPSMVVMADEKVDTLMLEVIPTSADATSNDTLKFVLSSTPEVSFSETGIIVKSETFTTQLLGYDSVVKMWFKTVDTDTPPSGIDNFVSDNVKQTVIFTDGVTFTVEGVDSKCSVRVFALDGKTMPANIDRMDNGVTVHLDALQNGVYVIMIANQRYKVVKK